MKKNIFFWGMLFSFYANSAEVVSVSDLLKNPEQLDSEILILEKISGKLSNTTEKDNVDKLKFNLIEIKRQRISLKNENSLDDAIEIANKSRWANTSVFLSKIKMTCLNIKKVENECFLGLAQVNEFLRNRQMPEASKIQLQKLVNDYSKYQEARLIINEHFIEQTDKLIKEVTKINSALSKPLAVVKLVPSQNMIQSPVTKMTSFDYKKYLFFFKWTLILGGVAALLSSFIYRVTRKRKIKRFYTDVFYITKRQRIPTKFYGKIKLSKVSKLKRVDNLYLNLLNSSGSLKSKLDVRLRNRGDNLLIETVIYSNMPIQDFSKEKDFNKFSQELQNAEKEMIMLGGELHLSNSFDYQGKFVSSSFIILI